jgi:hypothetical protein
MIIRGVFFCLILFGCLSVYAQITDELPTNSTQRKRVDHRKYEPKRKTYSKIYKLSTKKTLYGNPCALEQTRKMGFEYVPLTKGRGKTAVGVILNNTAVGAKLFVTRTPFWKLILKNRMKDCRTKSGDGIG